MLGRRAPLAFVLLVFVVGVVAGVVQRSPYIGTMTEGHHQWLMAEYTKFVEYWTRDGLLADHVLTLESPRSIEATTFEERGVYTSFPPGGLLQVYFLHRILPAVPLVTLISVYGIAIQALVALIYGLLVFRVIKPEDRGGPAIFFPIAAVLTYLFHPAPYYFHPMTPFAFQAAMVPVALATTLEYVIRTRDDVRLRWLQSVILGWLAACDWTFITLGISLTLFRLLSPLPRQYERGRLMGFVRMMLQIWLLPGLVCLAFVANLYFNGQLDDLISRAVLRVGMDEKMEGGMKLSFWFVYRRVFIETLGNTQVWIHLSALLSLFFFVRNRRDPAAVICCIAVLAPYLYVVLLPNDVSTHDFQSMKFFVPLSLVAFGIIPYKVIWSLSGKARYGAFGLMVFLWAFYLIHFRTDWEAWYQPRPPATQALAEWLRAHATFDEVYLSDSLEIADNPPVPVAISYKRVWLFPTAEALQAFQAKLPAAARLRFVSKFDYGACFDAAASSTLPDGSHLYEIDRLTRDRLDCLAARWQGKS